MLWIATPLAAQNQPDVTAIARAFAEFDGICKESGERLWGQPLCGRILLVDARTRTAFANHPDPARKFEKKEELYAGPLPPDMLIANTATNWDGEQWAMVMLPLPVERFHRIRLLAHESFHRLQPALGLRAADTLSAHLEIESGRLWLRLELRALAEALRTQGVPSRTAAKDALLFRAARHTLSPGAQKLESALEIQEGLAEYTGTVTALAAAGESITRVAGAVEDTEDQRAFARSFAYATGPALGILLDRFAPSWRKSITKDSNLAALLAAALQAAVPAADVKRAESRAERYGFRAVSVEERARAIRAQAVLAAYRKRFLEGPVLEFPQSPELNRSFNPNNLVPLGDLGVVYPTGTFTSRWGKLQVDDVGALLSPDNQSLRVAAPANLDARPLRGPGWRLELAPGWTIRPAAQPGSFTLAPE